MKVKILTTLFAITILLSACGGVPNKDSILQNARDAYLKAESHPNTSETVALEEARKALQQAENAENVEDMKHQAYLAEKKAKLAVAMAEKKSALSVREGLLDRQNEARLLSREKEISSRERELALREKEIAKARQEVALLASQNQELQAQMAKLQQELAGRKTEKGMVLTLGDVLFETGKADLLSSAYDKLNKIAAFLVKNAQRNILVDGHTDNVGTDEYNYGLSQRRADSVKMALVSRGVASNRITSIGYGEGRPIASNNTETGRQQNRRVEITILNEGL